MPKKLTRAQQSRVNGSKSHGPSTPEGQRKTHDSHMVHGFRSNTVAIHSEDKQAYDAHLDEYLARYTPIDKVEADLVGLTALNMWQVMRINSVEAALFDLELAGMDAEVDGKFASINHYGRLALAFKKSAGENAFELLRRYKSTAERAYHRAFQALEIIRKDRQPQQPAQETAVQPEKIPPAPQNPPESPKPALQLVPKPENPTSRATEEPNSTHQVRPQFRP